MKAGVGMDKLNEQAQECERLILSALSQGWPEAIEGVQEDFFTTDARRSVFRAMKNYLLSHEFEYQGMIETIKKTAGYEDVLSEMGGGVASMMGYCVLRHELAGSIDILQRATEKRRFAFSLRQALARIDEGEEPEEVRKAVEKDLIEGPDWNNRHKILDSAALIDICREAIFTPASDRGHIFTQFKVVDAATGGMDGGDLVILSAPTGGGKSALALNMAIEIAAQGSPSLYVDSEMSERQQAERIAAYISHTRHKDIRGGNLSEDTKEKVFQEVAATLSCLPIFHERIPDLNTNNILLELRRAVSLHDIKIVFVDYIGRCDNIAGRTKNIQPWEVLTDSARRLKTIAQELNIVVVMLAQLSKDNTLARASYMLHEADAWLNLRKLEDKEQGEVMKNRLPWSHVLEVRKARNGETGVKAYLRFDGDFMQFTDDEKTARKLKNEVENNKANEDLINAFLEDTN